MNQKDADRLAQLAVSSWTKRGLPIDVWAEELLELEDAEAVELAIKRLRRRTEQPPDIAALRAELRTSSSAGPPRLDLSGAISLSEFLARSTDPTAATVLERKRRHTTTDEEATP